MSREPKRLGALGTTIVVLIILGIIAATGFVVWLCVDMVNREPEHMQSTEQSVTMPIATEVPTELPPLLGFTTQGNPTFAYSASYLLTVIPFGVKIPLWANSFFAASLFMATLLPKVPVPVYLISYKSNIA